MLKLKQLLDAGALTKEEFDEQKKHILSGTNKPQTASSVSSTNQDNSASLATETPNQPLHIEGSNKDNTTMYCIIAIIVFVIIFVLSMGIE